MSKDTEKTPRAPRRGPGTGANASYEKAKDFGGTMKKLLKHLSQYKILILLVILFSVGSAIFSIIGLNKSVSKLDSAPWKIQAHLSSPAPVSIFL